MLSVRFDARRHKDIASPSDDIPWRDRRTGTILASGAKQNWPTAEEERYLKRLYEADREQQKHLSRSADNRGLYFETYRDFFRYRLSSHAFLVEAAPLATRMEEVD